MLNPNPERGPTLPGSITCKHLHAGKLQACTDPTHHLFKKFVPASFWVSLFFFFLHVDNTSENHFYSIRPLLCSLKEPQIPPGLMNDILGALQ